MKVRYNRMSNRGDGLGWGDGQGMRVGGVEWWGGANRLAISPMQFVFPASIREVIFSFLRNLFSY